ncbi:MAG: xanthine dehydrogenase family protein subunit M [Betaproteobacteria bacterium]|nr:MAG: xanthine dehydrogenase family protein subunit M [Betaproteobacteria bacterium]
MDYQTPTSAEDAARLLAQEGAEALAGGTDLLVKLRAGMATPSMIVDLKSVPRLRGIEHDAKGWRIGAATPCAEIGEHAELAAAWPGVVEALQLIGSTQIQGRATLGGNLCNASPAADTVPALIAAGAICEVAGVSGERELPVQDVITSPGKNALARGEFIVGFRLPDPPKRSGDAYLRLIPRTEMDIAVVGAGVALALDAKGVCTHARVALGAVAPTPLLVADAAKALIGTKVDDAALESVAAAASAACKPIDDKRGTVAYRVKVAGVLAKRAARIAYQRASAK